MIKTKHIFICLLTIFSCAEDNDDDINKTLAHYIEGKTIELGGVIACAASDETSGDVLTFYYPEEGATNIYFYQTESVDVDSNDFLNYSRVSLISTPFFNGYLGRFTQVAPKEKWIIITFELEGEIKISNPIRSKQITKPTVWSDDITINQNESGMPKFNWTDNAVGDNAIYFQVLSDDQNNLLSGTYTFDNFFQYYDTENVVLNITTQPPPNLIINSNYNFTLMDVSEDNWVNWVVQKSFKVE